MNSRRGSDKPPALFLTRRFTIKIRTSSSRGTRHSRKSSGQSLVEFTLMLPILLMMLSGLIEFGFLLNYYLDIIDAARETARFAANDDPIRLDTTGQPVDKNPGFYDRGQDLAKQSLSSSSDDRIQWPEFIPEAVDCSSINGDVVLSAFSLIGNTVGARYPLSEGENGVSMCGKYYSKLTTAEVNNILSGSVIPNSGFVLVEIYYDYDYILGLPWITAVVPGPLTLYAYSIMPNTQVEPTPTPPPGGTVTICHLAPPPVGTVNLIVGDPAIAAHLGHGDYLGTC